MVGGVAGCDDEDAHGGEEWEQGWRWGGSPMQRFDFGALGFECADGGRGNRVPRGYVRWMNRWVNRSIDECSLMIVLPAAASSA